jgi:hypothetical protein
MRSRLTLGLALAAVAACNGDHMSAGGGGTRVLLTDAPFPFDQVSRVDVYIVSIDASASSDTTTAQTWTTLVAPNRTFNLLEVQGGATALLGETEVSATEFAAIRMVLRTDLSGITLADGSPAAVNWLGPTTQTINALVEQPLSMTTGGSGNLIIDFDVGRSFVQIPGGGFQFLPWIRAVNEDATGTIEGDVWGASGPLVDPARVPKASVAVFRGGGTNALVLAATGVTDAQGHYAIHYMSGGGPYVIEAAPPANFEASPGYMDGVYVTPGQTTTANVSLNAGSATGGGQLKISGPSQVTVGDAITLSAFVFNANGDSVYGAPVTWQNSNPTVARLDGSGFAVQLTGLAVGTTSIEAWSNDLWDSVVVTVGEVGAPVATVEVNPASLTMAVGDSSGFQAILKDAIGNVLADRQVDWSVDSSVVNVLGQFGNYLIVRAVKAGTTTLHAFSEGKEGTATVTVQ